MRNKWVRMLALGMMLLAVASCSGNKSSVAPDYASLKINPEEVYRGFDIGLSTSNEELDSVLAVTGANLIRLMGPYVSKEPPYNFIESSFRNLNRVLDWAKENNVRVCIDPHTTPGVRNPWTIYPDDEFWKDRKWWDHLIKVWVRIAQEHKDRGREIYGYDLLNEPAIPDPAVHGNQWNQLVALLVDTVRSIGVRHPVIVEPTWIRYS